MQAIPLSYYQKPFWFDWKISPNSAKYNTPLIYRIEGDLNIKALSEALTLLLNEFFTATKQFCRESPRGEVEQMIHSVVEVNLQIETLSSSCQTNEKAIENKNEQTLENNQAIEAYINRRSHYVFNLTEFPLFKFGLLKVNAQEAILVLNFSHFITDGYTGLFFVRTLSALYNHLVYQTPRPIAPCRSYAEYIVNEEKYYSLAQRQKDQDYWQRKLSSRTTHIHFPRFLSQLPKPEELKEEYGSGSYYFTLDAVLFEKLKKLAEAESTTVFIILSVLYAILLYRYTHQSDICFCYSINTRPSDYKEIPGCFINTIPWIMTLDNQETVLQLIGRFTEERKETKPHQRYSLTDMIHLLNDTKKSNNLNNQNQPNDQKPFNVGIGETYLRFESLDLKGLVVTSFPFKQECMGDLFLAYQITERLECRLDYRVDRFAKTFIQQMASHFQVIAEQCISNPNVKITDFCLLTEIEKNRILYDWNSLSKTFSMDKTIHQLVEQQVLKTPDQPAVLFENETLSFDALNRKANQLARAIRVLLNQKQDKSDPSDSTTLNRQPIIAIALDRQFELVIGILAVLKAGACYMPLDGDEPESRLQLILENANVDGLLTLKKHLKQKPNLKLCKNVIPMDSDWPKIEQFPDDNLPVFSTPSDLMYIIHTSGTTGVPKGVLIEHKSMVNIMFDLKEKLKTTEKDKILNLTSVAFDVYGSDLFHCLLSGACHILCSNTTLKDPEKIARLIERNAPVIVHGTPTTWSMVLNYLNKSYSNKLKDPITIICGGETLTLDLVKKLNTISNSVWNFYGPTEATICSTFERVVPDTIPGIGKGFANVELYVLDEALNPVPIGVPGELYIGGVGLARGYLNDPKLSEQKFIPNPILSNKGLVYKTGDWVCWRQDGSLEHLGRYDSQIKIRGFRVELGEIETLLSTHPKIAASWIIMHENQTQDQIIELFAYYIPQKQSVFKDLLRSEPPPTPAELSIFLKKHLPAHMQPVAFVPLKQFPVTISGKRDLSQLPEPALSHFVSVPALSRPYDTIELALKEIWKSIFQNIRIGVEDDFFTMGGHSLTAITLVTKINEKFNVNYPVVFTFSYTTIRAQAQQILKEKGQRSLYNPIIRFGWDRDAVNVDQSNTSVDRLPVVFIHPAFAGAEVYDELAHHFGKDIAFYAIDSYNLNSGKPWLNSIEALADTYIQYLRLIKPQGPYVLGGWSFGGLIAYEMARQLTNLGEEVRKLYFLDAFVFQPDVVENFYNTVEMEDALKALPVPWRGYLNELPKVYVDKIFHCFKHDVKMLMQYVLKPYSGSVLLLKPTRFALGGLFKNYLHNGWKPFIKNLKIKALKGDHYTLVEGVSVQEVASILKKDLTVLL